MALPPRVLPIADGVWNIRGSFKLAGIIDLGTHCSLIRRNSGKFVFLDGYTLTEEQQRWVLDTTDGGRLLEAVLHVHPFHTLHAEPFHRQFPDAKLHGTQRHRDRFPDLPWEAEVTESAALHELFADDFTFTVPAGVDFIPDDESLHFSSVLVHHGASRTLHVDDTLTHMRLPPPIGWLKRDRTALHPTLARTLQKRPGAAAEFRAWGNELRDLAAKTDHLCTAHTGNLHASDDGGFPIADRIDAALRSAEGTLKAHEKRHGS